MEFFAAAGEHEGVASFETHDVQALACQVDEQLVDCMLRQCMVAGFLPGIDTACRRRDEGHDGVADEVVIYDRLGVGDQAGSPERVHIPAVAVQVVDPVGAGNAFCGGLLVGWCETGDWTLAGKYGAVAASFVVEQVGVPVVTPAVQTDAGSDPMIACACAGVTQRGLAG